MLRAMATRAASICLVSSQQRCSAINPYSPKATVWPRVAKPARLPRCILRYFTLSGINGITESFYPNLQFAAAAGCGWGFSALVSPLQIQHLIPSLP